MATLTITRNYADATVLYESDLDDIKSSIETFVNTTKLGASNIQAGSITEDKINDSAVTTAKISSSAVTTSKILDGAVTKAKQAALGQQLSTSTGASQTVTGTSYADVTNLSVSITTVGRPVMIMLQPESSGDSEIYLDRDNSGTQVSGYFKLVRDSTDVHVIEVEQDYQTSSSSVKMPIPPGSILYLDAPAAGTYTYKIQCKAAGANERVTFKYIKLLAYEL